MPGSGKVTRMGADVIKSLLHLYNERKWLADMARHVSDQGVPAVMREIVRRQVHVDHMIAEIEATGRDETV